MQQELDRKRRRDEGMISPYKCLEKSVERQEEELTDEIARREKEHLQIKEELWQMGLEKMERQEEELRELLHEKNLASLEKLERQEEELTDEIARREKEHLQTKKEVWQMGLEKMERQEEELRECLHEKNKLADIIKACQRKNLASLASTYERQREEVEKEVEKDRVEVRRKEEELLNLTDEIARREKEHLQIKEELEKMFYDRIEVCDELSKAMAALERKEKEVAKLAGTDAHEEAVSKAVSQMKKEIWSMPLPAPHSQHFTVEDYARPGALDTLQKLQMQKQLWQMQDHRLGWGQVLDEFLKAKDAVRDLKEELAELDGEEEAHEEAVLQMRKKLRQVQDDRFQVLDELHKAKLAVRRKEEEVAKLAGEQAHDEEAVEWERVELSRREELLTREAEDLEDERQNFARYLKRKLPGDLEDEEETDEEET